MVDNKTKKLIDNLVAEAQLDVSHGVQDSSIEFEMAKNLLIQRISDLTFSSEDAKTLSINNLKHGESCVPPKDCVCKLFSIQNKLFKIARETNESLGT